MTVSPTRIGSYRVVRPLGSGGMAHLFLAEPAEGGRRVAIKVIRPDLAHRPRYVEMFLDEARVLERIDHPNVVSVEKRGLSNDTHYLVMEYVDGVTLQSLVANASQSGEPLGVDVAIRIALMALDGLEAAHECTDETGKPLNLVHRDISPHNVLVGRDGQAKIIDFGIAKAHGRIHQTKNGNIKGKLRYMAPEHCGGQPVDQRTDLYALAILLWEMLTLRPYFDGDNELQLVSQVRRPTFRSVSAWNADVGLALEGTLRKALHPVPDERYQSARLFREALLSARPSVDRVGPAHVAAAVSQITETKHTTESRAVPATATHWRAAMGYTFHVVVPDGGHDEVSPRTQIIDVRSRRMARRARYGATRAGWQPNFKWLVAVAMVLSFMSGVTGVAMGHALTRSSEDSSARIVAAKSRSWR